MVRKRPFIGVINLYHRISRESSRQLWARTLSEMKQWSVIWIKTVIFLWKRHSFTMLQRSKVFSLTVPRNFCTIWYRFQVYHKRLNFAIHIVLQEMHQWTPLHFSAFELQTIMSHRNNLTIHKQILITLQFSCMCIALIGLTWITFQVSGFCPVLNHCLSVKNALYLRYLLCQHISKSWCIPSKNPHLQYQSLQPIFVNTYLCKAVIKWRDKMNKR